MSLPVSYSKLRDRFREVILLQSSSSVLSWDQDTQLPPLAADFRAAQLAYLNGQAHRLATATDIAGWLADCEAAGFPSESTEGTNVRGWRRDYDLATKVPVELVEEFSTATSAAHHAWLDARKHSDFDAFTPYLEKVVELCRRKADCYGWTAERYDALLNLYEPGAKSSAIAALFDDLGPKLAKLIPVAEERSRQTPENLLQGHYPAALQEKFNREVAAALGFEFNAGFLATSAHPFCTELGPLDVRMTTRYDETDFLSSLYGVMHETGHGLYDQGLTKAEWGYPAGRAISLGIHESQSRLWENHVGRSEAFWSHWLPKAAEYFPNLKHLTPSQMTAAASRVERSLIRVEADEVTYDQHIILRFGLERELINGTLSVREIPERWNAAVKQLLGLTVPDAARGCLQDIHWSFGGFGYFATYSLGNLNAAQLMQTARKEIPNLDATLETGNYAALLEFVRTRIHQHGSTYQSGELMSRATGRETDSGPLLAYLQGKYCGG